MKNLFYCLIILLLASCADSKQNIDILIINGTVYTVDSAFSKTEAIAIKDGKILETGSTAELEKKYNPKETLNAEGKFIYPGFIDAHAHFAGYGQTLEEADLVGTKSWQEIIDAVKKYADTHQGWISGRGWDQNDWKNTAFPDNTLLNELFPDRPVILGRIDGHAAIANQHALDLAGVKSGDKIEGGSIEVKNGKLTGILIDNAIDLVRSKVPAPTEKQITDALLKAQANCFAQGLTTIHDCGLSFQMAELIDRLQKDSILKMKLNVLLSDSDPNYEWLFKKGKVKTDRLTVGGFKVYADGALGSRGACLLKPYSDEPGWTGFLLSTPEHFDSVANIIYQNNMQMCTHAIGDSGNRTILNIYAKYLNGKNDLRWRIEHVQVINPNDFKLFGDNSIVPSIQPTHATSDMYWAEKRLGSERIKGAYAYKDLLNQNGWVALGTDFPVEDISPMKTFLAAVFRQDAEGYPKGGFQPENALSREETLRGMTIWAAKSAFEEKEKGSLEAGKFADLVILDQDIMTIPEEKILSTGVTATFVNGEKVFGK